MSSKNGFTRVVIGVSGGVDSALTAAIAVDALGAEHVLGVFMPSPYTSQESEEDVVELVRCLGIDVQTIPIAPTFEAYRQALAPDICRPPGRYDRGKPPGAHSRQSAHGGVQ